MKRFLIFLSLLAVMVACSRYEAIPWQDVSGPFPSVVQISEKIASALGEEVRKSKKLADRRQGSDDKNNKMNGRALRVVIAAFPEVQSGLRTTFSAKLERALYVALAGSPFFDVIDEGNSVSWQETGFFPSGVVSPIRKNGILGSFNSESIVKKGKNRKKIEMDLERKLDDDHPIKGLWAKTRKGRYGENSAVFAASMLDADAAIYGAYALVANEIRIWAAIVLNKPIQRRFYRRGIEDIFGLPQHTKEIRPYLGYVRSQLPRKFIPERWLSSWITPRPRPTPRHPMMWGTSAINIFFERVDSLGRRSPLRGGEIFDSETLVIGRLGVSKPQYVFGFAIDETGQVEEIVRSIQGARKPVFVEPGRFKNFTVRLLPPDRFFRIYFISSENPFDTSKIVEIARTRLGLFEGKEEFLRNYSDVVKGVPKTSWFVPPGQDRLILKKDWGQRVFWFHRVLR